MRNQFFRRAFLPVLALLCAVFSAYDVSATHFRYGSISWRKVSTTATTETIEFKVSMAFRRTFYTPLPVEGATVSSNTSLRITGTGLTTVTIPVDLKITSINPAEDWLYGETLITRTFPKPAAPVLAKAEILQCCRISTLKIGKDTDFMFSTKVNLGSENNNSPVTTLPPIVNVQTGQTAATFKLPATDADGDPLTYRLATAAEMPHNPPGLSINSTSGIVTFNTVGKIIGDLYAAQLIVTDSKGASVPADFIIKIVKISTPPFFDYTVTPADGKVYQINPGQPVSFPVVARDIDPGSSVTLSAVGVPAGSAFVPTLPRTGNPSNTFFSWTPTATQFGTYVINFTATDNEGSQTSSSVSIVVSLKPRFDVPPTPEEDDHMVVQPGTLVSFPVQASDPDPDDLVSIISADDFPANATFTNPLPTAPGNPTSTQVNWTPLVSQWGHNHITFTAEDSHGDQATHEIAVLVNTTPVFTSTPVTSVKEGQLYSYLITGLDPDVAYGDQLEIHGFGIPAWLTLTDNGDGTALLTGTPSAAETGTHHVGINLEDLNHHGNVGGMPVQEFDIEVLPCNIVATLTGTNISCVNYFNGSIDLTINGGTAPFTINWSNGAATEDLAYLGPGKYIAEVSDAYGCLSSDSILITEPALLLGAPSVQSPETCPGSSDGVATINISGGTAPYTVVWEGGVTTETVTGLTTGTYNVTVTDANGCTSDSAVTIIHNDTQAPVASAKDITVYLNASGVAVISASDIDNGSSDNCVIAAFVLDKTSFNGSNLGTNNVVLTVTDVAGLSSSATAVVTVLDNTPPVAITKDVTIYLDAAGLASITADDVNNGSYDNNAITSVAVSKTSFDYTNIGVNTVILTVTDASGLTASAHATVTVIDNIAPVISVKNAVIYLDATGSASITPADVDNGSSDNGSVATRVVSKEIFNCSETGINTVTLTVTDFGGNSVSGDATVTVIDNIAPVAAAKNVTLHLNAAGIATLAPADIDNGSSDNCNIVSYAVNKTFFNGSDLGSTPVVLTVTDAAGLTSSATAIVTISDTIRPTVITKNITVILDVNGTKTITPTDVDNGSSDNSGTASVTLSKTSFDCSNLGPNVVTVTVTDASGNVSTGTSVVTVTDATAPVALAKNLTVQLNSAGHATITAASVNNGSSDNCGIVSYSLSKTTFKCSDIGANNVVLTVKDASGNTSSATAVVTVQDNPAILNLTLNASKVIGNYNTSCNTSGDGTINLSVTGGTSPYAISWSNGATGTMLNNLLAGTYSVTVTDPGGCSRTAGVTLSRPENCDCITIPATAPVYTCTGSIDGTSNPNINGGTVCINSSFTGNVNFQAGTLVIKGNAVIPNLSLNAGCTLVVIGTLKSDYINLNAASATIINYGKIDVAQNVSPSGAITNHNVFNIQNTYNNNPDGKLVNKGTFYIKNSVNVNGKLENYASLIIDGTLANNSGSNILNKCSIRTKYANIGSNTVLTNNGTFAASETTTLNTNAVNVTSGAVIKTKNLTTGAAAITNSQAGCALVQVSNNSTINGLTLTGTISFCDSYNGIETSSNLKLFNGANLSCVSCSYNGTLAPSVRVSDDMNETETFVSKSALVVYPNPAGHSVVTLNISGREFRYKIIDMQGFVVSENTSDQGFATLSTEKLTAGLYVIEAIDANGATYIEKLIVQ
jgi:hypothetical protein